MTKRMLYHSLKNNIKKKFDYELAAVMPEYENIQLELEGYLLDKLSKKELSEIYDL